MKSNQIVDAGQHSAEKVGHIPGIDGLRAIAVLAVVIYHLDPAWLPGGFAGVDIFFVISGYVVAASIRNAPRAVSLASFFGWFYRRRLLRIFPAALFFVAVMLVFSVLFIPPTPVTKWVEPTGVSAIFGLSNFILFWKAGDYFASSSAFNPFTHTWSLAVEEQYYLLFPFAAYFIFRLGLKSAEKSRVIAIAVVGLTGLASFCAALWLTRISPSFAFYMLPTRLWELVAGFGLYLIHSNGTFSVISRMRDRYITPIGCLAVACLAVSIFTSIEELFPAPGAIFVCLATVVVLHVLCSDKKNAVGHIFSLAPLRFIGKISYSLYLWHWGVIVAFRWTIGLEQIEHKAIALCCMVAGALASYYWVEQPFRNHLRTPDPRPTRTIAMVLASTAIVAASCSVFYLKKNEISLSVVSDRHTWDPSALDKGEGATCDIGRTWVRFYAGNKISFQPKTCPTATKTLFVIGDSHSGAYERMLYRFSAQTGWAVQLYSLGGCAALTAFDSKGQAVCKKFREMSRRSILESMKSQDVLFVAGFYMQRYREVWDDSPVPESMAGSSRQIKIAQRVNFAEEKFFEAVHLAGVMTVLELPKPVMQSSQFRCSDWFNERGPHCAGQAVSKTEFLASSTLAREKIEEAAKTFRATTWNPANMLCGDALCAGSMRGRPLYYDTDHLSAFGNDYLLLSFIRAVHLGGS